MPNNTFTDPRDGQVYKIVKIGEQIWFAENFRYKCKDSFAYGDDESYVEKYGRLYTWEASVNNAPPGWHLPTRSDFEKLKSFVEVHGTSNSDTVLKSKTDWFIQDGKPTGTDEFGFNVKPAGLRNVRGIFANLGYSAHFWTSRVDDDRNEHAEIVYSYSITSNEGLHWSAATNIKFLDPYLKSVRYIRD